MALLVAEKERHLCGYAGIPDGADVDLSPDSPAGGRIAIPRRFRPGRLLADLAAQPAQLLKGVCPACRTPRLRQTRFHGLRGIHATALLDAGIPVHIVAQRIGDDPAVLLRNYAKRRRSDQADKKLLLAISTVTAGFLRT